MDIKIPKITVPLDLGGYSPALAGQVLQVWVNPPLEKCLQCQDVLRRSLEIEKEMVKLQAENSKDKEKSTGLEQEGKELLGQIDALFSEIWSQGAEETHLTAENICKFRKESLGTDPRLFWWIVGESVRLIKDHRQGETLTKEK
jgi:hypothetical protein